MKIPPYWSKAQHTGKDANGRTERVVACGWSFSSLEDARTQAGVRAKRIFDLVAKGQKPNAYEYSDRPVKEEIIRTITDGASSIALITRNRYGALVLNSANVLFADVDFPAYSPNGFMERLALAFSGKKREEKRQAMVLQTVQTVAQWAQSNPMRSFRVYRTPQGLRLLFVDKLYDPTSEETLAILRGLKTDPMYIKLTQKQECFRARLTAKPWRCGCPRPPHLYPWDSPEAEQEFRQWESRYTSVAAKYRACEYVKAFGAMAQITAVQAVIKAHDDGTMMDAPLPLG